MHASTETPEASSRMSEGDWQAMWRHLRQAPPPTLDATPARAEDDERHPAGIIGDDEAPERPEAVVLGEFKRRGDAATHDDFRMTRDAAGRPVLDPRDPMPSARTLLADGFMSDGLRTMHHYRGTFWRWDCACYRDADPDSMQAQIWSFLDGAQRYGKDGDLLPFQPSRSTVDNVASAFKAVCNLPNNVEAPAWLGDDKGKPSPSELLPVQNGLLHLPSGQLTPPSPAFFCLNASSVPFNPDAPEPTQWLRFLDLIWPDDRQSVGALQDIFGYLLSPDTSHQKIPLIVGPKRSGKGTIARILTALLGQDSVTAPTLASLATNFGLAPLIGKSVAIIGDARLSGKADQSAIAERLLSISGEDSITVDRKFQAAWTGRLGVRFVIMSNELPRLSDASGALASRFLVLTMTNSFYGREDRGLANRLIEELPGILNWAREGYLRLKKRGYFVPPESAQEAVEELEALGSPIAAFVKAHCVVAPGQRVSASEIFDAWRDWCEANGRREAGTAQSFGRDLRAAVSGLRVSQPSVCGVRLRYYEGIALQDAPQRRPDPDW